MEEIKINEKKQTESVEMADFPDDLFELESPVETFIAKEIEPTHPAEPELFARHEGIPAHDQKVLSEKKVVMIGGGGLGSWIGLGLIRSGLRKLTAIDFDRVDRTNLSRQFFFQKDLGEVKGIKLAENLAAHAVGGAEIVGIGLTFEEALTDHDLKADVFVVGVDNNACRLEAVREAKKRKIPSVFTMLSRDGMRCQTFLQGKEDNDPCLWCALPNLDPERILPCASAIISSCFMASAMSVFFVHRALMGWGNLEEFNWREMDLTGMALNKTGTIKRSETCLICKDL